MNNLPYYPDGCFCLLFTKDNKTINGVVKNEFVLDNLNRVVPLEYRFRFLFVMYGCKLMFFVLKEIDLYFGIQCQFIECFFEQAKKGRARFFVYIS